MSEVSNNPAYDRWQEARKQWDNIITNVQILDRHLYAFLDERAEKKRILSHLVAFAHLHCAFLNGDNVRADIVDWIDDDLASVLVANRNPADVVLCTVVDQVGALAKEGALNGFGQRTISKFLSLSELAHAANERIFTTSMPFVFSLLIHLTIYLYCGLLSFILIGPTHWLATLFAAVGAYIFWACRPSQMSWNGRFMLHS
ncbi:bestrophin family ion channel [Thalassobacter sp. 16PALIMAR09]|uniref:bestrophin family ion channel n=1 Tax=Thalassobacter sp. 16PALIMAR09 TaxID=1225651 RepID=UPI002101B982|nr:bestrophin family ion channel [Thalassobacter sp. 16PALIMAR09]